MRRWSRREKVLLGVLLFGGAVFYLGFGPDGLGLGGDAAPLKKKGDSGLSGEAPLVRTDLLALSSVGYDPLGRDLFQYYVPPPPPVKPPPPQVIPPPVVRPPPPLRPPQPPRPPVERPPEPDFKYIGHLGPKERPIAVFEQGLEQYNKGLGEVVDSEFRLIEVKFEAVVLGFVEEKWAGKTVELKQEGT